MAGSSMVEARLIAFDTRRDAGLSPDVRVPSTDLHNPQVDKIRYQLNSDIG